MSKETNVGKKFKELVELRNRQLILGEKIRIKKIKGGLSSRNEPDWLIVVAARTIFIEVKQVGQQQTPSQRLRMRWWSDSGARCVVCSEAYDMMQIVEEELTLAQTHHHYDEEGGVWQT